MHLYEGEADEAKSQKKVLVTKSRILLLEENRSSFNEELHIKGSLRPHIQMLLFFPTGGVIFDPQK